MPFVMPTLADVRRKATTITIHWPTDDKGTTVDIQVTYDPGKITMGAQDLSPDDPRTVVQWHRDQIKDYVTNWDLMGDDGQKLPITDAGINQIESALAKHILDQIMEDQDPKKRKQTGT